MTVLKRKTEKQFFQKKVNPGQHIDRFIGDLEIILKNLHDTTANNNNNNNNNNSKIKNLQQQKQKTISYDKLETIIQNNSNHTINYLTMTKKKKKKKTINYPRLVKRLKHKLRLTNVIIQRTDKSKVFHLGKQEDYQRKFQEQMAKTAAYQCLDKNDPLPELIQRTNNYLLNLRLVHWITQRQYEKLSVKPNEVQLAHLYYLPKAHKPNTPLRPIIAGIKHPTIKISRYLDTLLRPLFDKMATKSTVASGTEVLQRLNEWSKNNLCSTTILCTIDVTDLYTMIPQAESILSIRKMLDKLQIKQIDGVKPETIIRLSRLVLQNNYFTYNDNYYHQIRGGAMGSPLTLTLANCYMFFFEENIIKQITNSGGLYVRYIDDIFIAINWPIRHLNKQIDQWNNKDLNIKLNAQTDFTINFLNLYIENNNGQLITKVYHKPSYEPYYLSFNSIHPQHMKKKHSI